MPFLTMSFLQDAPKISSFANTLENHKTCELSKILPNTLYLTFNAPKVDDFHRGLFITPPSPTTSKCTNSISSGTLFHAIYTSPPSSPSTPTTSRGTWSLERRPVRNIANSKSLVLFYRISSLKPGTSLERIEQILRNLSLEGRGRDGGRDCLGGYSCVLWTEDALKALCDAGVVAVERGMSVEDVMWEGRTLAGPEDAREMVGKDFGGLRVFNSRWE